MSEIPEEAVTAAAAVHTQAINDLIGQKRTEKTEAHIARVMLEAAAPFIAAAVRERIARHVEDYVGNYPADIFPPDSDSRDAISGTAARHAYLNAARSIREDWPLLDEDRALFGGES